MYEHILNVFNKFQRKTTTDYHDLKCNILLLADVYEKTICNSLEINGLCLIWVLKESLFELSHFMLGYNN